MPARRSTRKKTAAATPVGLTAAELTSEPAPAEVRALVAAIGADGGTVLASYRDPFGGKWVVVAGLPIDKVQPTPFQRELSPTHAGRLAQVIPKVGRFLDPVICIRKDGLYWTPNGMHRLQAMRDLAAKSIVALVLPDEEVAYRILALNTEKAHNLKDKALEVIRMAHALSEDEAQRGRPEREWGFEFEEPAYLTLGLCYEKNGRFSGGAYLPVLKRCEAFFDDPIAEALVTRGERAAKVLALDTQVAGVVERLKAAGFTSGYLKPFVVARINPLRFQKVQAGKLADFDTTIDKMTEKAEDFDASKVKEKDLAAAAAYGGGGED